MEKWTRDTWITWFTSIALIGLMLLAAYLEKSTHTSNIINLVALFAAVGHHVRLAGQDEARPKDIHT